MSPLAYIPILAYDAQLLSPSFGYVFDRRWVDPHESIVSMLWKFVRANALAGHIVAGELGNGQHDPYEGMDADRESVDIRVLRRVLGIPRKVITDALIPRRRRAGVSTHFRYCRRCLGRGYHSVVHQFEIVSRCPIHDDVLHRVCRNCGYAAPYRLNASLLEMAYKCPMCRMLYGTRWPRVVDQREVMPMKDLIPLTRMRIARCWY